MLKFCILSLGYIFFHKLCSILPSQSEFHSCHCILKGFPVLGSEFCRSGLKPCLVEFLASAISEQWSQLQAGAELNSFFPRAVGTESLHSCGGMDMQRCSDGFSGVCLCPGCVQATAAVSGLSWQGGDQSKAGLSLGALFLQDVSVGCCRCLPMALMLQFQPGYPSVSIFHTDTWGCKKPDLSILCQIIIDSGESLFMQWVIPLISVGGPRCRSANPECWGNNTFFFL